MIAVDTHLLIYAHRADSEWHDPAKGCLRKLAEGRATWGIPWPCIHEFLSIVTHPRVFEPPSSAPQAVAQVNAWLESPTAFLLAEGASHWKTLESLLTAAQVRGPLVHDARIAAICLDQGVRELWTADRDFGRFPSLATRNPLVD